MAPIDIVEAQSEVARNEETVIVAEAAIKQAEDRLRALIFDPGDAGLLDRHASSRPRPRRSRAQAVDVDAAVRSALDKRTDVQLAKNSLRAERHQHPLLPQPDAARGQRAGANYGSDRRRRRRAAAR